MKKILSQEEIDALLSTVSKTEEYEEAPPQEVTVYDFKHPDRISKDQLRSLRTVHENFSRLTATYLSTVVRAMVDVNLLSIDQVTYSEYTMSLNYPSSIYVLHSDGLEGKLILEMSPSFLLFMVDRLLGGTGETTLEPREITLIEQNVVHNIILKLIEILNEVWGQIVQPRCRFNSFETDPQFVQIARSSETLAIIFFELKVKGFNYPMNLGIPYFILEPILPKLSTQSVISTVKKLTDGDQALLGQTLTATRVPLSVQLSRARISIRDFLALSRNDVVSLDTRVSDELLVTIGGRAKFRGVPGKVGRHNAVRISRMINPSEGVFHQ